MAFLLFLLPYSSVPGTVFPFWCLLQSFLIRHISAHKNLAENPEQHFYVTLLLDGKLPAPAPHSSSLIILALPYFCMRLIYLKENILIFGFIFSLFIIFLHMLPLTLLRMYTDRVCTCYLLVASLLALCVVHSCSVPLTLKSGILETSRCDFST